MLRITIFCLLIFLTACSDDDPISSDDMENSDEEPIFALDFISTEKISDTPDGTPVSHIIFNDILYALYDQSTYAFDFATNTWELLLEGDSDLVGQFGSLDHIEFIREGKWYIFNDDGLLEYDFEINNWTKIIEFPRVNGRFGAIGTYVDGAVYFVDKSNSNPSIYRYDFDSMEVEIVGSYDNPGNFGGLTRNIYKVGGDYFYSQLTSGRNILFSQFSDTFENLETLNEFDIRSIVDNGVSWVYEDKIIFGLGGSISLSNNGSISSVSFNDKLFVYDTGLNEFATFNTVPFETVFIDTAETFFYNNEYYLLGGRTIINNEIVNRNSIDKITFDLVRQE